MVTVCFVMKSLSRRSAYAPDSNSPPAEQLQGMLRGCQPQQPCSISLNGPACLALSLALLLLPAWFTMHSGGFLFLFLSFSQFANIYRLDSMFVLLCPAWHACGMQAPEGGEPVGHL